VFLEKSAVKDGKVLLVRVCHRATGAFQKKRKEINPNLLKLLSREVGVFTLVSEELKLLTCIYNHDKTGKTQVVIHYENGSRARLALVISSSRR
jgi:cytoplasmic iron level regulating protein YaaA (DUF328/UPF0246 family)